MSLIDRRRLLSGAALVVVAGTARAGTIAGALHCAPGAGAPPRPVVPGPWHFFTPAEGRIAEAGRKLGHQPFPQPSGNMSQPYPTRSG